MKEFGSFLIFISSLNLEEAKKIEILSERQRNAVSKKAYFFHPRQKSVCAKMELWYF